MRAGEDADIGPRFVERVLRRFTRRRVREDTKWIGASAFHFGYAIFWGACYALAYHRWRPHPLVGGGVLAAIIYAITFPRWGGAVVTGSEPAPGRRSWRHALVLATAALTYGLGTALLYGRPAERRRPRARAA